MKRFFTLIIPPIFFVLIQKIKHRLIGLSKTKQLHPDSAEYWQEHIALLEQWGEHHVWNEIELLLHKQSGKVLDIACGTGPVIERLKPYTALELYGLDNNKKLIEGAIAKGISKDRLFIQDCANLQQFKNNYFSHTISLGLLYYLEDKILDTFIEESHRVTSTFSAHMILTSLDNKDQEIIETWQTYRNNSTQWWINKFKEKFTTVHAINSGWTDHDYKVSKGTWLICYK